MTSPRDIPRRSSSRDERGGRGGGRGSSRREQQQEVVGGAAAELGRVWVDLFLGPRSRRERRRPLAVALEAL